MTKTLRVPHELRFVRALALAVNRGDSLNLLLEVGALLNRELGIVRRVREALEPAYALASSRKHWDLVHASGILQTALSEPDSAAHLAHLASRGANLAEVLAVIGCAHESKQRPWDVEREPDRFNLSTWRGYTLRLLPAMPDTPLPKPLPQVAAGIAPVCLCAEPGSLQALAGNHTPCCSPGLPRQGQAAHHSEAGP